MSALPSLPSTLREQPAGTILALAALAAAGLALTFQLWPHWLSNPDLSHGFFVPFLYLLLLRESRTGPPRQAGAGVPRALLLGAMLLAALLAIAAAGLYAAAVDWSHALVNVMLALALALFTGATAVALAAGPGSLLHCNWPAAAAAGLWLLSTPIPPGTYTRLTLTLQLWVSEGVLRTIHLLGIAAVRHGNIIDLANTSVGVEEACSGIRSLISCLFAGLFFSATLVRRPWSRALLLLLAAPLAFAMNFLRSLFLTLLANAGVDIAGAWHDATGFAVLGLTAALLGALALLCERRGPATASAPSLPVVPPQQKTPGPLWALNGAFATAACLVVALVWNTRPSANAGAPVPNLPALLPESPPGWEVRTTDLYAFRGTLQTEHLAQRDYLRREAAAPPTEIVIYAAYWRAGQASVSLVASHTPDACWPGAGWELRPNSQSQVVLRSADRTLPAAEYRVFASGGALHHVWFWHLHDGRPLVFRDPYSAVELLRLSWKYGLRRSGDQLFVRVSSNRPWAEIEDAAPLREFFSRIRSLGL